MAKKIAKPIATIQPSNAASSPIAAGESMRGPRGRLELDRLGADKDFAPTVTPKPEPIQKPLQTAVVEPFGIKPNNVIAHPNDAVVVDVRNALGVYLETNFRSNNFVKEGLEVTLDVEADLKQFNYITGKYNVEYKFHRNYLGSGDGHKLEIQEISSDGMEVRVVPTLSGTLANADFLDFFAKRFFEIPKSQVLPNLLLQRQTETGTESYRIFDYVQDKFTVTRNPYSIVLKLASPIPTSVTLSQRVWISQQISDPIVDTITLVPPKPKRNQTFISGPNWDVMSKTQTTISTPYKDWDDLLSTSADTTEGIINKLLSGSLVEGIKLNIDYRSFENHITFGSATERLQNFRYKLALIESYNARIAELTTNLNSLPSSSVSSSLAFQTNVINAKTKKAALLGGLDSYENYIYNQSSSYESSSYGEFYPTTWPKQNYTKPYLNYSITASQSEEWFEGILSSASLYDANNDKALYKLIPAHVLEDGSNEEYVLFTQMIGHYFDILSLYVKQITSPYDRNQSTFEGFSRELIYSVANNLGIDFDNGNSLDELWAYTLGTDSTGSAQSIFDATSEDRTKEIWKRIINNLPYLLKTKGTERGVRALINCYGIPQTILRIREYGGAEPEFDTKTDLQYERFNYALNVGWNGLPSGGLDPTELISVPWTKLKSNNLVPMSVQLRVKMAKGQTKTQTIFEVPNRWKVEAFQSGSSGYVGFYLSGSGGYVTASVSSSIYDGTFHSITLQRGVTSDATSSNQTYTLIAKKVNYDKVVATQTASLYISGSSGSYNNSFVTGGSDLWIPGSGSFTYAQSKSMAIFTGSVQELRYWSTALQDAILDNHALAPTSFQGNTDEVHTGSTSSYYDLAFRLCLGSDNKKINYNLTSSATSQHPNQFEPNFSGSIAKTANFYRFAPNASGSMYEPITERHSLEWPDLGGNRSVGTKIRIEDTFTAGSNTAGTDVQLYRDNSVQRSLADSQPPDSSRLGIYLSPQNEINQDIAEHFGGISIDDYIGDPTYLGLDHYPGLEALKWEWSRKFVFGRNQTQNYIRLIRHYDSSLFQLIKKFVPYRANTQVGLVIEPIILERAKIAILPPKIEELHYDVTIDASPDAIFTPGGAVQDGDGEPFRDQPYWANNGYVPEGKIGGDESDYLVLGGQEQGVAEYAPQVGVDMLIRLDNEPIDYVVIDGTEINCTPTLQESTANQFNGLGLDDNPSTSGSMAGQIDFGISQYGRDTRVLGSQYVFMTWATSGSPASAPYMITSSHYSYHQALNPVILDNRFSEISNIGASIYDVNIYNNKAFSGQSAFTQSVILSSSIGLQESLWTSQYGLRILSSYTGSTATASLNTNYQWRLDPTTGFSFFNSTPGASPSDLTQGPTTGSAQLDAFFYKNTDDYSKEYIYEIAVTVRRNQGVTGTSTIDLFFGGLNSTYTQSIDTAVGSPTTYTFTSRVDGPKLCFVLKQGPTNENAYTSILGVSVKALNYRAQVQDFHLRDSYGMRNARYDGCKMTSTDYNVDSPDTSDGGPVITITLGTGRELTNNPTTRGNFTIT